MTSVAEKLAKKSTKKQAAKQVRLKLVYVDFWSALKLSFLAGIAVAIVTVVFFFLVFTIFEATGVFAQVNSLYADVADAGDLSGLFNIGRVMGFGIVLGILNLIVITALGALAAALYNLSVKVSGGLLVGFTNQ